MLAKIITSMCVGQLLTILFFVLGYLIYGVIKLYCKIGNEIALVHKVNRDILLFRCNKQAFMEWKKERGYND